MPVEQFKGVKHSDHRVDVYAVGVMLYRGLTGRFPFRAESYGAMAIEIATATVAPPSSLVPGIDPGLDAIVLRAMARDPDARFGTMDELAEALSPFVTPASTPSSQGTETSKATCVRWRLVIAMAAAFFGAMLVGFLISSLLPARTASAPDPGRVSEAASPLGPPPVSRGAPVPAEITSPPQVAVPTPVAERVEAPAPTPAISAPRAPAEARTGESAAPTSLSATPSRMRPERSRTRAPRTARGAKEQRTLSLSLEDF